MKKIIAKNKEEASRYVAERFMNVIYQKYEPVLGFATGGTPKLFYSELINAFQKREVKFNHVKAFNLDEYLGLAPDHAQSYAYYMETQLYKFVDFNTKNTHIPNGLTNDPKKEAKNYEELIELSGGIDIQLLGIGVNGHIGFNEPSDTFQLYTHVTHLKESTIKANARYFESHEDVPKQAITMGVGTIMKAKRIILLAFGEKKQNIMKKLFDQTTIDPNLPASILHAHQDVTVVMDEDAAKLIEER